MPPGDARAQYPGRLLAELLADQFGVAIPVGPARRRRADPDRRGRGLRPGCAEAARAGAPVPEAAEGYLLSVDAAGAVVAGRDYRGASTASRPSSSSSTAGASGASPYARPTSATGRSPDPLGAPLPARPRPARLRPADHARRPAALQVQRDRARGGRRACGSRATPRSASGGSGRSPSGTRTARRSTSWARGSPSGPPTASRPRCTSGSAAGRTSRRTTCAGSRSGPISTAWRSSPRCRRSPTPTTSPPPGATWPRTRRWPGPTPTAPRTPSPTASTSRCSTSISSAAAEARAHRPRRVAGRGLLPPLPRQGHGCPLRRGRARRSTGTSARRGSRRGCGATTSWTATTASGRAGRRAGSSATSGRTPPPPVTSSPPRRATSTSSTGRARRATRRSRSWAGRSWSATSPAARRRTGGGASPARRPRGRGVVVGGVGGVRPRQAAGAGGRLQQQPPVVRARPKERGCARARGPPAPRGARDARAEAAALVRRRPHALRGPRHRLRLQPPAQGDGWDLTGLRPGRHYAAGLPYAIADPARWGGLRR